MKIKTTDLYIKTILLFPVFTVLQSYLDSINRLLFALLVIEQLWLLFDHEHKLSAKSFVINCIVMMLEVVAIFNTNFPLYNINDAFYFPFFAVYTSFCIDNKAKIYGAIKRNIPFMGVIIIIWSVIVGVSVFLPGSYKLDTNVGGVYFASFTSSSFRLAPTALFIMALVLTEITAGKNKKWIVACILPLYCFMAGGSRTYFGIGALLFIVIWYKFLYNKNKFWLSMLPLALIGAMLFANSSIAAKMQATSYTSSSYFDFWGTITNSRSVFWAADLAAFSNGSLLQKLAGYGFNFVYDVNVQAVHARIWAHNDFVQVLTTYGIVGILMYFILIIRLLIKIVNNKRDRKALFVLSVLIWFVNAMFNMFYTYFCSVLCFPLILFALNSKYFYASNLNAHTNCDKSKLINPIWR